MDPVSSCTVLSDALSHGAVPLQGLPCRNALCQPSLLGQVSSVWAWENQVRHFFTTQGPLRGLVPAHRFCSQWNTGRVLTFQSGHISVFCNPHRAVLEQAVLCLPGTGCTERWSNLHLVTWAAAAGLGTRTRIFKSLHLNTESHFTLASQW